MSIFDKKKNRDDEYEYDESDDMYEDPNYEDADEDDDDDEQEEVSRFAEGYSSKASQSEPKSTYQSTPKPNTSAFGSFGTSSNAGSSYSAPRYSNPFSTSGTNTGSSNYQSNFHKSTTRTRRTVEELFIAELKSTNDALSVADLVKEKKYALIVNLNPLKTEGPVNAYSSVVNFIDGVCYVTDSEFTEINEGSGLFLIYHKDIILNEGLGGGYYSSNSYNL